MPKIRRSGVRPSTVSPIPLLWTARVNAADSSKRATESVSTLALDRRQGEIFFWPRGPSMAQGEKQRFQGLS